MIDEPGRFIDDPRRGCDSITFHVEIEEEIAPTLGHPGAGRAAGLGQAGDAAAALEPYRDCSTSSWS